jgi:flagellar assembly protein FliH
MVAISKFLFDTDFDAGDGTARPAPKPESRKYTASEVEAARAAGHAAGMSAGRAEAEKEAARRTADALDVIAKRLGDMLAEATKRHESETREAVQIAAEIVRRLLPALGKRESMNEVEALIVDCLSRLHDEPRLVVRVADELMEPVRQRIDALAAASGFAGRTILLADGALKPGDARVEWADGGVDRDVAAVWREIDGAIQRFVEDGSGAPDAVRK